MSEFLLVIVLMMKNGDNDIVSRSEVLFNSKEECMIHIPTSKVKVNKQLEGVFSVNIFCEQNNISQYGIKKF